MQLAKVAPSTSLNQPKVTAALISVSGRRGRLSSAHAEMTGHGARWAADLLQLGQENAMVPMAVV